MEALRESGFTLSFIGLPADYDGECRAALISKSLQTKPRKAVLYIHGFIDYFFQKHLAEFYLEHGYDFYALELRKYGRAMMPHQRPNHCRSLDEYFPEIRIALKKLEKQGYSDVHIHAHSTGALIASLYLSKYGCDGVRHLVANSPFLEFKASLLVRKTALPALTWIGGLWPELRSPIGLSGHYGKSIHKSYRGQWDYDQKYKPVAGFPIHLGWIRAAHLGHMKIQSGLKLKIPILILHSHKSWFAGMPHSELQAADGVLDVKDIRDYSLMLGNKVTLAEIRGAVHDVFLSAKPAQAKAFEALGEWLTQQEMP